MKKKLLIILLVIICFPFSAQADSVILMMGDGMGQNHLQCAQKDRELFMVTSPVQGVIQTRSASHEITDSAAAATAYSCGFKTINGFLGLIPDENRCLTIAEEAVDKKFPVGIYSTDVETGASPSAFIAHVKSRHDREAILEQKKSASERMNINYPVEKLSEIITPVLEKLNAENETFFVFFEEAYIDIYSHKNELDNMKKALFDFDLSVRKAVEFTISHPDATVIVLADHETGGLTETCEYTTQKHTPKHVPVFAFGKHANLFMGEHENTAIYAKMRHILFEKQ